MIEYFDKIYKNGLHQFQDDIYNRLVCGKKTFIITANPETLMIGKSNREFNTILCDKETIITPDGIGVVKGANQLGYQIKERVTGVDSVLNKEGKSLYLFGAKPEVLNTLVKKIKLEYPNIKISGATDGYVSDKDAVFEQIALKKPDVVMVALGIPAQELLISRHIQKFNKGIKHNLEWLYRICSEPKRLKRFYKSNIRYLGEIRKVRRNMR